MLEKSPDQRKHYDGGRGYLIAVGATKGAKLFDCTQLVVQYFYDALDMSYEGGLLLRELEKRHDVRKRPEDLEKAFDLGKEAAKTT
jgi:hypothetical protein